MRTTISLDDHLGADARRLAAREGLSLSAYIARLLRDARARSEEPEDQQRPFRLVTVAGGGPRDGVDLDRTSAIVTDDDQRRYGSSRR